MSEENEILNRECDIISHKCHKLFEKKINMWKTNLINNQLPIHVKLGEFFSIYVLVVFYVTSLYRSAMWDKKFKNPKNEIS